MADTAPKPGTAKAEPAKANVAQNSPQTDIQTVDDNPKIVAQPGTVPSAAAAPGPSLPHPSVEAPIDTRNDTPEMADARVRALGIPVEGEEPQKGDPVGDPIQTIVKQDWYDSNNRLVRAGETYFFQLREGESFPLAVLEPVDEAVRKDLQAKAKEEEEQRRAEAELTAKRREAFARLALETE